MKCPRCGIEQKGQNNCEICGYEIQEFEKAYKLPRFLLNSKGKPSLIVILCGSFIVFCLLLAGYGIITNPKKVDKFDFTPSNNPFFKNNKVPVQQKKATTQQKVVCKKFRNKSSLNNRQLALRLDTDLPSDTKIMVQVCRPYWKISEPGQYCHSYYENDFYVRELEGTVSINIDDARWKSSIEKHQKLMASVGEPYRVSSISNNIILSYTVPIRQKNPRFGKGNINLVGSMVNERKTIRNEKTFYLPMDTSLSQAIKDRIQANLLATELETLVPYRIPDKLPIFPELNPSDPINALSQIRYLPPGSIITIVKTDRSKSTPYYYVKAFVGGNTNYKVEGWVNSTALMGQELSVAD